jgi:phosphatidylglycerophosphate synthase
MADVLTFVRMVIVFQIISLSLFLPHGFSYNTILSLMLIGWITDILDGRAARYDKNEKQTWFGQNERKVDLFMVGAAHLYLSRFVIVSDFVIYLMALLGFIALLQMVRMGDTELLLQMIYITLVCGYIIIMNVVNGDTLGIIALLFLLTVIIVNWDKFKDNVLYFVSFGRIKAD